MDGSSAEYRSGGISSADLGHGHPPTQVTMNLPDGGWHLYSFYRDLYNGDRDFFITQQVDRFGRANTYSYLHHQHV